jgi:hypothetical protein
LLDPHHALSLQLVDFFDTQISADLPGKKIIDFLMPGNSRTFILGWIHPPGMTPAFPDQPAPQSG